MKTSNVQSTKENPSIVDKVKKKLTIKEFQMFEDYLQYIKVQERSAIEQKLVLLEEHIKNLILKQDRYKLDIDVKLEKHRSTQLSIRKENLRWLFGIAVGLVFLVLGLYFR